METIISSLISAGVALVICVYNNKVTRDDNVAQQEKSRALLEYKLEELSKKVEQHNDLISRTYELEKKADIATAEFRRVNHRLEKLESGEDDKK